MQSNSQYDYYDGSVRILNNVQLIYTMILMMLLTDELIK